MVHVNGKKVGGNDNICKFTAYVSPYFVVSNGGAYTKHIYAANQRIASKLGNVDGFGADPRRVEMAGGKKYSDNQSGTIKARFEALNIDYSDGNGKKDDEEYEPTMDSEEKENLVFFYHPDHLGSTSYVTDADGNIAQHIEYIPYGEVFVEERNSQFSTNFLFNAKELDNETGLYYYGARYLDPTGAMWLSVDPVFHAGTSPYAYSLGNPVVMVDPDGRDEWTVDQEGVISKIGENTDVDIFYGLDSEGNRVSEISFSYRTIESINEDFKSYKDGDFSLSYINVNNSDSAKDLFEFLSQPSSFDAEDNTGKEWSLLIMDGENILSSSHEPACDRASYEILKNKTGECVLFEHYHCHPNNNPFPSGTAEGDGDIPLMKRLKNGELLLTLHYFRYIFLKKNVIENTMKIRCMKYQNWKLLHLEYISSMVKFYLIILLIIQPKFILAQDEVMQGEDDYIYDFDTVVPIFSVNDDMLEIALDSMCSYFEDIESIPKQWDLVLSYIDSEKINFYFSLPFFLSIHKVGYGVLRYKDFLFVIRGIKYSGLVETTDKANVCMCPSYPCFTWDPPSALFVRENDTLYKVYITK